MKFLLADDESVNHRVLRSCIKKIIPDAEFFIARNGEEAIVVAQREQPDVIFLDDKMPDPQGCWACSEIRINEKANPEGIRAFIVTYSSTYANNDLPESVPEDDRRRKIYPEADSFHPKKVDQEKLKILLNQEYHEWKERMLTTKAAEPTTPTAGAGGGTGEAVPPLVPHDALTAAITGEFGRLAMSPPSKPSTLAHTAFSGEKLRQSPAPTEAPSLRHSPSLAAAGHQSFFWRRGDERSLSPSVRRAPRLLDAPTARLPRSAASSPMLMLFDKKSLAAASTGAAAPTASESTPLGGTRVARV
jgi:CheY-like chemotaxis protein